MCEGALSRRVRVGILARVHGDVSTITALPLRKISRHGRMMAPSSALLLITAAAAAPLGHLMALPQPFPTLTAVPGSHASLSSLRASGSVVHRVLELRGGSLDSLPHADRVAAPPATPAETRGGHLPHSAVVARTAAGVCAQINASLSAALDACARSSAGAVPPLSPAAAAALRALPPLLESMSGGQDGVQQQWLLQTARQITALVCVYMGSAHDLALEIELFDSLRAVLEALGSCLEAEECGSEEGAVGEHGLGRAGGETGVGKVHVPWRRLVLRYVLLHVPLLGDSLHPGTCDVDKEPEAGRGDSGEAGYSGAGASEWMQLVRHVLAPPNAWLASSPWLGAGAGRRHRRAMLALFSACHGSVGEPDQIDDDQGARLTRSFSFFPETAAESMWRWFAPALSPRDGARAGDVQTAAIMVSLYF